MPTINETATVETKSTKTATAKKATKKAAKKVAKKAAKKSTKSDLTAMQKQAEAAKRPIKWSETRVAVVKALRKLGAIDENTARVAGEISAKSGVDAVKVKIHCDVYRGNELIKHGFVKSVRPDGSRELAYYLTAAGRKVDMAG